MAREQDTNPDEEEVKRLQAIKEQFKKHDFDPAIVDEIAEWGRLCSEGRHGFNLEIRDEEGRRVSSIRYFYSGFLKFTRFDPEASVVEPPEVEIWRIPVDDLSLHPRKGMPQKIRKEMGDKVLQFEADFGRMGINLAWFNNRGEFQASIGEGVRGKR